jgi:hypothetical protein
MLELLLEIASGGSPQNLIGSSSVQLAEKVNF